MPQQYTQIKIYYGDEHIQGFAFYANNTEVIIKIGIIDDRLDSSVCKLAEGETVVGISSLNGHFGAYWARFQFLIC